MCSYIPVQDRIIFSPSKDPRYTTTLILSVEKITAQHQECQHYIYSYGKGKNKKQLHKKVYDTGYSQAVTHPSTNPARRCLTSVIRRELVLSAQYGRRRRNRQIVAIYTIQTIKMIAMCRISVCRLTELARCKRLLLSMVPYDHASIRPAAM